MRSKRKFRKTYTVFIKQTGTYNDSGRWSGETESQITIRASVQPLTGLEVSSLPENLRSSEWLKLYSSSDLPCLADQSPADILIDGKRYQLYGKSRNQNGFIDHFKYLVVCNGPERS